MARSNPNSTAILANEKFWDVFRFKFFMSIYIYIYIDFISAAKIILE